MNDEDNRLNAAYSAWQDRQDYYHSRGVYWDRDKWRYESQYPDDLELDADQFAPGAMRRRELEEDVESVGSWEEF